MEIKIPNDLPFTRIVVSLLAVVFVLAMFQYDPGLSRKGFPASLNEVREGQNTEETYVESKIYFNNQILAGSNAYDCGAVFPVNRSIPSQMPRELATVNELVAGPTYGELQEGYTSIFSADTTGIIRGIKILNGIAYIDFGDIRERIPAGTSSCGSRSLLSSIETTLAQFPAIKDYRYAILGSPEDFYEWIQVGCPSKDYCDPAPFR